MSDIADLERRIKEALEKIGAGVEALTAPSATPDVDPNALAAANEALEAEKLANAQLEERVKSLHQTHETQLQNMQQSHEARAKELEAQLEALKASSMDARNEVQKLRKTNQHLSASLQSLRQAAEAGVEPHMINQAMMSELDGLRSLRDADRAELDAILGQLQPMLTENTDA